MKKTKSILAFTLAEVLITLGIIGVVSALTIPTVHADYKKKGYTTSIRKILNDFESAVDTYITEEGKTSFSATGANTADGFKTFMNAKFNTIKTCSSSSNCFSSQYKTINGSSRNFTCSNTSYILSNSAAVCPEIEDDFVRLYIDINGLSAPNTGGRDMFSFKISPNGYITTEIAYDGPNPSPCRFPEGSSQQENCINSMQQDRINYMLCPNRALGETCIDNLKENNWVMTY